MPRLDADQPAKDTTLPAAMTGTASPAKAAVGDKPVSAYISSPTPSRVVDEAGRGHARLRKTMSPSTDGKVASATR